MKISENAEKRRREIDENKDNDLLERVLYKRWFSLQDHFVSNFWTSNQFQKLNLGLKAASIWMQILNFSCIAVKSYFLLIKVWRFCEIFIKNLLIMSRFRGLVDFQVRYLIESGFFIAGLGYGSHARTQLSQNKGNPLFPLYYIFLFIKNVAVEISR